MKTNCARHPRKLASCRAAVLVYGTGSPSEIRTSDVETVLSRVRKTWSTRIHKSADGYFEAGGKSKIFSTQSVFSEPNRTAGVFDSRVSTHSLTHRPFRSSAFHISLYVKRFYAFSLNPSTCQHSTDCRSRNKNKVLYPIRAGEGSFELMATLSGLSNNGSMRKLSRRSCRKIYAELFPHQRRG